MKSIRDHLLISIFLIAMLMPIPRVWATMRIHRDGYAHLYVVFSFQDIIGCEVEVSGNKSKYLLAYNTRTKNVSWRRQIDQSLYAPSVSDKGKLFFIEGNYLHCINVLDGITIHVIDLRTLQWPPFPEPDDSTSRILGELRDDLKDPNLSQEFKQTLRDEIKTFEWKLIDERQNAANAPIEIWYPTLVLTPTSVFIGRRISIGSKYNPEPKLDTEDWILLDLDTYKFKRSGEGERIFGRVSPDEFILGAQYSSDRLSSLKSNTIKDLKHILDKDRPGWSLRSSHVLLEEWASHDNRWLSEFIQHSRDDSATIKADLEHYALYDSRTENFSYLDLEPIKGDYTDLFILSTNLVRYSRSTSGDTKTNSSSLLIEVYSLQGQRINQKLYHDYGHYRSLDIAGRTTKGDLVFTDQSYYGGTGMGYPYAATGGVLVVEIPSLKIKATHQLPIIQGRLDIKAVENTDQIVLVQDNIDFQSMKTDSLPHQFIVRGMDVYSGKELWRFKEDVLIRKLKEE